ncbi:MAG: hypothetical protein LBQ22_05700 [Bacteroidales bacterium]|jgi:hypothetical protein|nr:hypothetical protein [Bacteroidales bacterium]
MNEDEKTNIDLEREQLNLLIKRGVKFEVVAKIRKRNKGLKGFFKKPEILEETTSYEIHEPTLSVLDRLSEIWLDMAIDEEALKEGAVIVEAKKAAKQNAKKMARVIAIAVLGEDYHITEITRAGKVKRYNDDKELNRLTNIFFHAIKPSKLALLSTTVTNVSNLADFITSMRLMSGARTTKPITGRIE